MSFTPRTARSTLLKFRTAVRLTVGEPASESKEYHGVVMRSRLEVDFARHLHQINVMWEYEPRRFYEGNRSYLPDFRIALGERPCYVEVKPTVAEAVRARKRMEIIWATEPDAFLVVVSAKECRWYGANKGVEWTTWVERWEHR